MVAAMGVCNTRSEAWRLARVTVGSLVVAKELLQFNNLDVVKESVVLPSKASCVLFTVDEHVSASSVLSCSSPQFLMRKHTWE